MVPSRTCFFVILAFPYASLFGDTYKEDMQRRYFNKLKEIFPLRDGQCCLPSHRKAPQFMMDLFDAVADTNGISKNSKIMGGNIVRSLAGQSNGTFHFFNLTSFGVDEKLIKAEFRWFRQRLPFLSGHHFYKIDLYEVMDSTAKPWRGNLITSRLVPAYTQGWEVFNITQIVSKWIHNSGANNGVLIVTTLSTGDFVESIASSVKPKESDERNAYLVIFSSDGKNSDIKPPFDKGQNVPMTPFQRSRRKRRSPRISLFDNVQSATCQRTSMYVDFKKIGWSGWIISPRGFNAYSCKGSCPFPLAESLRATNHATVQSIVNTLKLSSEVGAPCCVPDLLHPLSLLYFDDEENVVLKQYDDMVAGSCGCH